VLTSVRWPALGSTAIVFVTEAGAIASARALLEEELAGIDLACSRFRSDSELSRLNAAGGEPVQASPLFLEAVETAIRVARATDGDVDPTVGRAMRGIGYDRDFGALPPDGAAPVPVIAAGWRNVHVDRAAGTIRLTAGAELDLGATAKALAADRGARRVNRVLGCGVLVNLGGDISVAGPPPSGGWSVQVCDDHADVDPAAGQTVAITSGGLATSSTTVRRWTAGGCSAHHIVDPRSGASARVVWRTTSVAAGSCVDANAASTAAIVRGEGAPAWLRGLGLPSRLIAADGEIVRLAGWPQEAAA
jgi:FAD:protein FMN transferase